MPRSNGTPAAEPVHYQVHLSKDKKLQKIITGPLSTLPVRKNIALKLIGSIMSQQLSTKVADVIYARFLNLYNGEEPTARQILDRDGGAESRGGDRPAGNTSRAVLVRAVPRDVVRAPRVAQRVHPDRARGRAAGAQDAFVRADALRRRSANTRSTNPTAASRNHNQ